MSSFFLPFYHSHPSDLKHRFHRHQSSSSLHGSFNHNHVPDTNLPLVAEEPDENQDNKGPVYDPKQDVFASLFVSFFGLFLFLLFGFCLSLTLHLPLLLTLPSLFFVSMWEACDREICESCDLRDDISLWLRHSWKKCSAAPYVLLKPKQVINSFWQESTRIIGLSYLNGQR